jgi:hypothetical protein
MRFIMFLLLSSDFGERSLRSLRAPDRGRRHSIGFCGSKRESIDIFGFAAV